VHVDQREEAVKSSLFATDFVSALPSWDRPTATDMPRDKCATNCRARKSRNSVEIAYSDCVRQICQNPSAGPTKLFAPFLGFGSVSGPSDDRDFGCCVRQHETKQAHEDAAPSDVIVANWLASEQGSVATELLYLTTRTIRLQGVNRRDDTAIGGLERVLDQLSLEALDGSLQR